MPQERTPKSTIIGRFATFGLSVGLGLFTFVSVMGMAVTVAPFLIGGLIGVLLPVAIISLIIRLLGAVFYGHDPAYQQFRKSGGDPYLDLVLPPPFNTDSWSQRIGGLSEPETDFVPPAGWVFQCPQCGARRALPDETCWHCGRRVEQCPNCGISVQEAELGDFVSCGVGCPSCGTVMRA